MGYIVSFRVPGFKGLGFAQRPGLFDSPSVIDLVLAVWGGGVGGAITFASATAILALKRSISGTLLRRHRIHVPEQPADYQSIHAQTIMTFMFESIPVPPKP